MLQYLHAQKRKKQNSAKGFVLLILFRKYLSLYFSSCPGYFHVARKSHRRARAETTVRILAQTLALGRAEKCLSNYHCCFSCFVLPLPRHFLKLFLFVFLTRQFNSSGIFGVTQSSEVIC